MKHTKFEQLFILSFLLLSTHFEYTFQATGPLIPILIRAEAIGKPAHGSGTTSVPGAGHVAGKGTSTRKANLHFDQYKYRKA